MKIIDCFPYFNEKELLELRINLLYDHVDKFIICDADHTHSGKFKSFSCKDTIRKLGLSSDKIQVLEVNLPSYSEESNAWIRERMQRNAAERYIQENDICIISDCDEIINPDFINYYVSIANQYPNNILRIPLAFLMNKADLRVYDLNNNPMPWAAPFLCQKHHLKKYTLSDIRESYALSTNHIEYSDIFITENGKVEDAGWHFSWMGDNDRIKIKNESFLHWNEVSVIENFVPIENSTDCLGRTNHILKKYPRENLPSKIFELSRVENFLGVNNKKELFTIFNISKKKSLLEILENNPFLDTDKNVVCYKKYPEKWKWLQYHSYIEHFYENAFKPYQHKTNIKFCEIGIDVGGSIALWSEYFKDGFITGIDITTDRLDYKYREENFHNVKYIIDDAYNSKFIDSLSTFDIIIDDGPHTLLTMMIFIEKYLHKLNPGGIMVIEDIPEIKWIDCFKFLIPPGLKTEIVDLRNIDQRYDSIIFAIYNTNNENNIP